MNESLPGEAPYPGRGVAWYAVLVLTLCYTFAFVDRLVLAFLVTPLKHDLLLTDTQIGLLQGLAFAVFYSVLGVPFGILADRMHRRRLITLGLLAWSAMTSLGSLAWNFGTLALARMGVGVGEATLAPAAFSLIADYFPKERLSSALSVYGMGVQLGAGLALIAGGSIVEAVMHLPPTNVPLLGVVPPWRLTFLIVGLPGIVLALLLQTLREPPRRNLPSTAGSAHRVGIRAAMREVSLRWRSAAGISLVLASQAMNNYAFGSWTPAYFERTHHWPRMRAGWVLGALTIGCGCLGLLVGGRLSDRWLRSGVAEAPLRVALLGLAGAGLTFIPAMLSPSTNVTLTLLGPAVFFLALPIGCSYASIQMIFPNQVRGTVSAMMLLVLNLVGLTLGTLLPGLLDDRLFHDDLALGSSIAITVACGSTAGALAALLTFAPYRRDFRVMNPS